MEQRTCNIIMCCKGNSKWHSYTTPPEAIMRYMGEEYGVPWIEYTDTMLRDIMEHAFVDFMKYTNNAESVVYDFLRALKRNNDNVTDAIIRTFSLLIVKGKNKETGEWYYINGFSEELIKESEKVLN